MRKDLGQRTQIEKKETRCERKKISAAHFSSGCLAERGDRNMAKKCQAFCLLLAPTRAKLPVDLLPYSTKDLFQTKEDSEYY